MKWWLILFLLFITVIFLVAITKLTITITFFYVRHFHKLTVNVKGWFGLLNFTYNIPLDQADEETEKMTEKKKKSTKGGFQSFQPLLQNIGNLYLIVKQFLAHITVHQFEWKSEIGTGDAGFTGMLTGLIWTLKGNIVAVISNYMRLVRKPNLNVVPSFQKPVSATRLECIFSFRIGHAIGAGFKIVKLWNETRRDFSKKQFSQKAEL